MRPSEPGRIPQQGPVYQRRQPARDSASSAALPLPPGTRESPPARSAGCSRKMRNEARRSCERLLRQVGDSQGGEFTFRHFRLASLQLREGFVAREKPGFVCATRWEAAEAVSSSNAQPDDGKYSPALPPPSTGTMPTSLLLPGKLPTWKELSRMNPCWSYHSSLLA